MAKKSDSMEGADFCFPSPMAGQKLKSNVSFDYPKANYGEMDIVGVDMDSKPEATKSASFVKQDKGGKMAARGEGHRFSVEYK